MTGETTAEILKQFFKHSPTLKECADFVRQTQEAIVTESGNDYGAWISAEGALNIIEASPDFTLRERLEALLKEMEADEGEYPAVRPWVARKLKEVLSPEGT